MRKGYKSILEYDKNIDKIIEFDLNFIRKLKGYDRVKAELNFFRNIRNQRYDLIINFHPADRLALWSFFSGAKYRVGYSDQAFNYFFNIKIPTIEESKSYLEYYLDTLYSIGVPVIDKKTYISIDDKYEEEAEKYFAANFEKNDKIVGIHPGASRMDKVWELEKYSELANSLIKNNFKVLLFKGPDDSEIITGIQKNYINEKVMLADTSKSMSYLGALMKRCTLIICNDSASSHLASAMNIKTIILISQEKKHCWKIYDESEGMWYLFGEMCSDCSDGVCKGSKCLKEIPVSKVLKKVMECINA
jgi:ADP-heptose:LPS heptosyltransferase